jgi:hypothetical protein
VGLEAGLTSLPDSDDRHVLAAAIHCGAQETVTFNLRDFPDTVLRPYGIRAIHPDSFIEHLLHLNLEAGSLVAIWKPVGGFGFAGVDKASPYGWGGEAHLNDLTGLTLQ